MRMFELERVDVLIGFDRVDSFDYNHYQPAVVGFLIAYGFSSV